MQSKSNLIQAFCSVHGKATKRNTCRGCNAAYMRAYLRRRRFQAPELTIWQRAHRRATERGVLFSISVQSIVIPAICPVLGIPIVLGERRSENSPSLDRIIPNKGYIPGNVRVISDRANRLKADLTVAELERKAITGPHHFREDYRLLARYVQRECLLSEFREKIFQLGASEDDWIEIADLINRLGIFSDRREDRWSDQQLTSQMIEDEFGLTKLEVRMLRRLAGFPNPRRKRDGFRFSRAKVEQWIAAQPDPTQPAAILSRWKRRRIAVNSKAAARLRGEFGVQGVC